MNQNKIAPELIEAAVDIYVARVREGNTTLEDPVALLRDAAKCLVALTKENIHTTERAVADEFIGRLLLRFRASENVGHAIRHAYAELETVFPQVH